MKQIIPRARCFAIFTAPIAIAGPSGADAQAKGEIDRTVLPIQEPAWPTIKELDARKVKPPPRFEVKAPKGAPNVVIVLIDDMGFGQPSTFGGGVALPTLDRLAANGLRYNQFHTTALCSPTRVALKYGRAVRRCSRSRADARRRFDRLRGGYGRPLPRLGGRGDLVGSFNSTATIFFGGYLNWQF